MKESSISKRADKHIYTCDFLDRPQSEIHSGDFKENLDVPSSRVTKLKSTPPRGLTNGLTNGVRSRSKKTGQGLTNGLTNGNRTFRGRGLVNGNGLINGNGLTNGNGTFKCRGVFNGKRLTNGNSIFKKKGLVNGNGLINGNGLTNGNGTFRGRGLINGNGIINGNGLTNGNAFEKKFSKKDTGRRMVIVRVFVVVILLMIPWLLINLRTIPSDERDGIFIDGNLRDWEDVLGCKDAIDDQKDEPSVNILDFRLFFEKDLDRRWEVKLAFYLEVEAYIFGNPNKYEGREPTSYAVHILIDSDRNPDTGYHVRGIGADYMVEIEGHSGVVHTSYLKDFDDSNQKNWNGFEKGNSIPSAIKDRALETQIYLDLSSVEKVDVLFHISDSNGNEDFSDTILSNEEGRLIVTQQNIAPEVLGIGTRDVEFLRLTLEAQAENIEIKSFNLTLVGSAQESDIEDISLVIEDGAEVLDMDNSKIATATFSGNKAILKPSFPLKLANETSTSLVVTVSISSNAVRNRVMGLSIGSRKDVVIESGTVTLQSDIKMIYIGEISEEVMIDGAFGDWNEIRTYRDVDDVPMKNKDVDIDEYKVVGNFRSLSFYFKVKGTMMGGTSIPMVPDYKEYVDIPVPNGKDNTARLNIEPEIIPHFEGKIPRELLGEDSLYIFIDSDQNLNTGFCTEWLPIGADHLIKISGKDGNIMEKITLTFDGESNRDIAEVISHGSNIINENPINNVSWLINNQVDIEAISCSDELEAKIEGKFLGNNRDVSIFFIVTNWNSREIDDENLLTSIEFGKSGSRSSLEKLVTGIGAKGSDGFGWNVSYAGDVDNDGYEDIIVGAPFNDSADGSKPNCGAVYIYFGYPGINTSNINAANANVNIYGSNRGANFGWSVSDAGDVNGDSIDDIIIGSPYIEDNRIEIIWGSSDKIINQNSDSANQRYPDIAINSSGDIIVVWQDERNGGADDDIYAQKFDSNGNPLWGSSDKKVNQYSELSYQYKPSVGIDPDGNAIVVWYDNRSDSHWDVYAQKLDADGNPLWGSSDVKVNQNSDVANQQYSDVTVDSDGNAIVVWRDYRNGNSDLYAQKLNSTGVAQWGSSDVKVNQNSDSADQQTAAIAVDTDGNAYVVWYDPRSGDSGIFAQKINSTGVVKWGSTDLKVNQNSDGSGRDSPEVSVDPDGNIVVVWRDWRDGANNKDIYAQKLNSDGVAKWGSADKKVNQNSDCTNQSDPAVAIDANGNAIVVWVDERNGNDDIYTQKLDLNGNAKLDSTDEKVNQYSSSDNQYEPVVVVDSSGDAVVVWYEWRALMADIYAQKLDLIDTEGKAYIFFGRATGSWSSIDDADTDADVILTGEYYGDKFGCSVSGAGDVNYDGWPYRKKITIDADKVTGDLSNFPILINIIDSDLRDKARHNGYDIYFTSSDGTTKLDHEIEKFNSHTGELVVWVEVQSLSSSSNTDIYMYYGKDNADDQSNPTGVWSNGYVGVYHMVEETGSISNSVSSTNDGIRVNTPTRTTGQFGYGQEFTGGGADDMFNLGDLGICDGANENITVSVWVNLNDPAIENWGKIIEKMNATEDHTLFSFNFDDDVSGKDLSWQVNGNNTPRTEVANNTWLYIVGTYNGSKKIVYINDTEAASEDQTGALESSTQPVTIGARKGPNLNFGGILDEVRLSNVARSAEWIETEFNNQNDTSSFYTVYSEEIIGGYGDIIVGAYGYGHDLGRAYIFYGPDFNMSGIPYSYAESLTETELSVTASWEDYLTLTVKPVVSTNYLIIATSDMGPDGTAPQAGDMTSLRLRINNTDTYHEVVKSFDDPTDWYHFSAVKYLTLLPGSHDIELEYKTDGDTGTFRNSRIIAIEMTIPSDQYDENESSVQSTSSEELAAGLTFTPSSSGEYLIIASANVAHTDNKNSVWGRMYIDGTLYGETLMEPTVVTELMNFGIFKNITLDANPHTINLTVLSEDDPADTSSMIHAHIVAIRVDTFSESHSSEAEAQNAGSGGWETLVTNSYTPLTGGDFIILGTAEWFTNDITAVKGIRLNTSGSSRQESMVENRDATDKHMTFQMDKRYLSGPQTDTMNHNVLATGWSKFARLIALPIGTTYTILTGEKANDKFGFSVSNAGRVNNDNYYDVIVGAPGGDSAYIFKGDDSMISSIRAVDANVILNGAPGTNFGFSVASCGNINNADGDDVIVGAPGYNANRGRAYIFYGREHNEIVVANYLDDLVFVYDYTVTEDWEAKINQSVGDMPYSVFVGDANNDGYNDILTADYNDNTVTIYNGTSSGGWEPVGKLYVGDSPRSVYVADTNNDSLNDIVTADYNAGTVTIYNGTVSGGWESNYTLSVGNNPYSVFVGDANNDGYNDILVTNYFNDWVSLYNGTSSGGWEAKSTFDVGESPTHVFIGDANNDGYNDIVTANSVSDNITIYNGTSNGGWDPKLNMSVGGNPLEVFIGDANNDGYNDILTSDRDDNTVTIYNGTSNGLWEAKGNLSVGSWPNSVFVGDANNDGYNDIVTSDSSSNTITIYNGTSTNDWESKGTLSVGSGPVSVFVGDANNDGRNDILTADSSDDTVTIYNGTGNRDWEMKFLPSGNLPFSVFVGDANNDGYNDILIADNNDDTVSLYNGTSIGGWETKFTLSVGTSPRSVFVADANNDGYNDILIADVGTNTVTIYNGTSSGGWEAKCTLSVGNMPYTVFVADANNDGYNDILTADLSDDNVTIYNGTGSGGWEPIGTLNVGDGPADLYVGDANNDGYNDIVTVDISDYTVTILNGTSSGSWEPKFTLDVGASPYSVFVGDANNDGYNDILTADQSDDTVTIYNGTGSGWEGKFNLTVGDFPYSVFVADANNDGYNDILTADYNDYTVTLYNGTASGDWEDKITLSTATYPTDVFVANANNDVMGGSINAADADLILTGESIGDKFGYSVHYAGDIDGDGYPDVIVGAPYHTNGSDIECGAMYVYCGGSDIDSTADYTNYGENAYDHFGWSVSYAGDINSDNYNDTLCGAPYYDYVSNTDAGKAYCHSTNVIPEFEEIVIPVFVMIMIFVVWRRKRIMKMRPKEIQNRKNRGMVENWNLRRCTK